MRPLILAALLSAGVALLHVGILWVGALGYRYFGAGERMARMAERGSSYPALVTLVITLVFVGFAACALSAAGVGPRPPYLRALLVAIAAVYTLRGLVAVPQAVLLARGAVFPTRMLVFSLVSLAIGLVHVVAVAREWRSLGS